MIPFKVYECPDGRFYVKYRRLGIWRTWKDTYYFDDGGYYKTVRFFPDLSSAIVAFRTENTKPPNQRKDIVILAGELNPHTGALE